MEALIKVENVGKRYRKTTALSEVNLNVTEGSCFGLLGPNGAGKSTLMKILTGIIRADSGRVNMFGMDTLQQISSIRRQVGYVPQELTLYDKLTANQNLRFFGEMYGVRGKELNTRITELLEQVGLSERANEAVGTYSGGMKRRINLAAALLHKPKLVILDEPTVGIDPQSRNHIFEMIRQLRDEGVTIIYSTHYMEEVEAICDDIAIIDKGKVIASGSLPILLESYAVKAVYLEAESLTNPPSVAGVTRVEKHGRGWLLETENPLSVLHQATSQLVEEGISVRRAELLQPSLESVFLTMTGTSLRD